MIIIPIITVSTILQNQELAITSSTNHVTICPSVRHILERELQVGPREESIWSRIDDLGQVTARLIINRPLYGNWVMITLEFGSNKIIIQYYDFMAPFPLLALLTLEAHNPSIDRSDEEL